MAAQALAQRIMGGIKERLPRPFDSETSVHFNKILAEEITSYLLENCTVEVFFEATDDPENRVDGSNPITGTVEPSESSGDRVIWLDTLGHNIATGFTTAKGIVEPLETHVSLLVPNDHLSEFIQMGEPGEIGRDPDPSLCWWTKFSDGIITMITSQISQPYPASLDGAEGTATVTKLNIT